MRFVYNKYFVRLFVVFVLISFFVIADKLGYISFVKSGFGTVFGTATLTVRNAGQKTTDFFSAISTIKKIAYENAELTQKVNELSFENARLQQAKLENATLRKALKFSEEKSYDAITSTVTFLDPTGFERVIFLDKGSVDGVKEGQAMVVPPGLLVGKITKVYGFMSEATLITDPSVSVNAEIAESGARGMVRGEHGLILIFDLVTQNEVIKSQDLVVTSGLGGDYPPGLLIGEVSGIKSSQSELFQKAYISPAADLRRIKFVTIIK